MWGELMNVSTEDELEINCLVGSAKMPHNAASKVIGKFRWLSE
jgi:hypothetical protein